MQDCVCLICPISPFRGVDTKLSKDPIVADDDRFGPRHAFQLMHPLYFTRNFLDIPG